ncbi:MAG: hypothetical protein ACQETE_08910 [Bacteroidota bacterium]
MQDDHRSHDTSSDSSPRMKNALRDDEQENIMSDEELEAYKTSTSRETSESHHSEKDKTTYADPNEDSDPFSSSFDWPEDNYPDKQIRLRSKESKTKQFFKNALVILICLGLPALWYFDAPSQWGWTFSGDEAQSEVAAPPAPTSSNFNIDIPPMPPMPDINVDIPDIDINPEALNMPYEDYLAQMDRSGYMDKYASHELRTFYQSGVTADYLNELDQANILDEFAFHEIAAFRATQLPTSYLSSLEEAGILDEFAFHEIIAFYEDDMTIDYLLSYRQSGYLDEFAFHEIIAFHDAGITTSYLDDYQNAGFLDDYAFHEIVAFYEDGIDAAYLQSLEDRGIREDLAFWEIVDMHE